MLMDTNNNECWESMRFVKNQSESDFDNYEFYVNKMMIRNVLN